MGIDVNKFIHQIVSNTHEGDVFAFVCIDQTYKFLYSALILGLELDVHRYLGKLDEDFL